MDGGERGSSPGCLEQVSVRPKTLTPSHNYSVTDRNSRTPQTDPKWKEELQYMGATIRIEPMDVTDKQDLIRVYEDIQSTMPPIAGVANGAMVLSDGLFADMTFASFDKVLKPKVDGSTNLDEVFSSQNLDFFIMFSSLSAVIGNPGQANYAAANMVRTFERP